MAAMFPVAVLSFAALSSGCGGSDPTSAAPSTSVSGATFTLRAVDGQALPARFEPLDDPQGVTNARLQSGSVMFGSDGRVQGAWGGQGDNAVAANLAFNYRYEQTGAQVLVRSYGDDFAPDTATVSGNSISVRAQFFRRTTNGSTVERYVRVMRYDR